jgi:superfamily II DNA or RNA helicase
MELRPYQLSAINKYRDNNAVFVAPTGAGKTILAAALVERLTGNVLVLTHREEILYQGEKYFGKCNIIKAGRDENKGSRITLAQVQTLARRDKLPNIAYVISDECQHSVSEGWSKILKTYPESKNIGLTATPWRLDGKGLGKHFDEIIEVATIAELIEQGYLVRPEYYGAAIDPDLRGVKKTGGDYNQKDLAVRVREKNIISGVVKSIQKYLAMGKHIIVYAVDRAHANDIYREIGGEYLDGKTHHVDRKEIITRFNTGFSPLIINVNVLTEGFDGPICDCIVLARPTCSTGLYYQMVGRSLRPYPGKQAALIIDHGGNVQRHGFVEEKREYTLADGLIVGAKKAADSPHTCRACLAVFYGKKCPLCGITRQLTIYEIREQEKELELIRIRSTGDEVRKADYLGFLNWARFTGRKPGAAYGRYKTKYGTPPKREWQEGLIRFCGKECLWIC